ncbi:hypothetical protein PoB_005632300 [Plakobranchus ocellatus]|uniref:Uncharacterized protein n=1 Tax=Plakobranchus ocellatus TaxID=259542 RepID=A0AAV4CFQ7_9GAST|nr:hypothetical protein PoB_005632300 [Plakobranchus ocellatus]
MKTFITFAVALSVLGAFAQDDEEPERCTPPSYTASSFHALALQRIKTAVDFNRSLTLNEYQNGNWIVSDFENGIIYTYTNGSCEKWTMPENVHLNLQAIQDSSNWMYSFDASNNERYNAWSYTTGNTVVEGLLNHDCVNTVTKTIVDGDLNSIEFVYNVNFVNPDFSELNARLAQAQDPTFCPDYVPPSST